MLASPPAGASARLLPGEGGIRALTDREFALFRRLIQDAAGIHLSEAKKPLLVGRLSGRLRELGLRTFSQYYERVAEADSPERVVLLDRIATNETHFFREPNQFRFLEERVMPQWAAQAQEGRRPRRIRVWSAACSTGEEPYSLAMTLLAYFPLSTGWEVEILATDLSTRALAHARDAVWRLEKAGEIPPPYLKRFMLRGTGPHAGRMKAGPEIRDLVRFSRLNLSEAAYPVAGPFDLIFCRNVLIYFDVPWKAGVVHRLLDRLAPDGYLFLGHAESLIGLVGRARSVGPAVYQTRP